jgi:hypothetical protein
VLDDLSHGPPQDRRVLLGHVPASNLKVGLAADRCRGGMGRPGRARDKRDGVRGAPGQPEHGGDRRPPGRARTGRRGHRHGRDRAPRTEEQGLNA